MLTMNDRTHCVITNVKELLGVCEKEILIDTNDGMLMIKGKKLKITSYSNGSMHIDGKLDSFTYGK